MHSYVLYYNIEKSDFNVVSAYLLFTNKLHSSNLLIKSNVSMKCLRGFQNPFEIFIINIDLF